MAGHLTSLLAVWTEYVDRLQATFDPDTSMSTGAYRTIYQKAWALVIDDIDKKRPKPFWLEEMFSLLNHRYTARMPTILTFNTAPGDIDPRSGRPALVEYVGPPTYDRIVEMAFDVLHFDGPSSRSGIDWGTR
jgi:DNA replication protein DnaC